MLSKTHPPRSDEGSRLIFKLKRDIVINVVTEKIAAKSTIEDLVARCEAMVNSRPSRPGDLAPDFGGVPAGAVVEVVDLTPNFLRTYYKCQELGPNGQIRLFPDLEAPEDQPSEGQPPESRLPVESPPRPKKLTVREKNANEISYLKAARAAGWRGM